MAARTAAAAGFAGPQSTTRGHPISSWPIRSQVTTTAASSSVAYTGVESRQRPQNAYREILGVGEEPLIFRGDRMVVLAQTLNQGDWLLLDRLVMRIHVATQGRGDDQVQAAHGKAPSYRGSHAGGGFLLSPCYKPPNACRSAFYS